jgi:hypothetical protein
VENGFSYPSIHLPTHKPTHCLSLFIHQPKPSIQPYPLIYPHLPTSLFVPPILPSNHIYSSTNLSIYHYIQSIKRSLYPTHPSTNSSIHPFSNPFANSSTHPPFTYLLSDSYFHLCTHSSTFLEFTLFCWALLENRTPENQVLPSRESLPSGDSPTQTDTTHGHPSGNRGTSDNMEIQRRVKKLSWLNLLDMR